MASLQTRRSPRLVVLDERLREVGASIAADAERVRELKSILGQLTVQTEAPIDWQA